MNPLCTAKSSRTGDPCKLHAIDGGTVCHTHGGSAPQVKQRAAERIRELLHPALARLAKLIESDDERVALGAVKSVLAFVPPEVVQEAADEIPTPQQVREWITIMQSQQESPITPDHVDAEIERLEGEIEQKEFQGWHG